MEEINPLQLPKKISNQAKAVKLNHIAINILEEKRQEIIKEFGECSYSRALIELSR